MGESLSLFIRLRFPAAAAWMLFGFFVNACGPGIDLERPRKDPRMPTAPAAESSLPEVPVRLEFAGAIQSAAVAGSTLAPAAVSVLSASGAIVPYSGQVLIRLFSDPVCTRLADPSSGSAQPPLSGGDPVATLWGVARFDSMTVYRSGVFYLGALSESATLEPACSQGLVVSAGNPARLLFLTQPQMELVGQMFLTWPKVAAEDEWGNRINSNALRIALDLSDSAGSSASPSLTGTLSRSLEGGVAEFQDLQVDVAGAAYTLTAAAEGISQTRSDPFDVKPHLDLFPAISVVNPARKDFRLGWSGGSGNVNFSVDSGSAVMNGSSVSLPSTAGPGFDSSVIRATDAVFPGETDSAVVKFASARFNGKVRAVAVDRVRQSAYFGGDFTRYNADLLNGLAGFDPLTGDLMNGMSGCNPAGLLNPGAKVNVLIRSGGSLILGGLFSSFAETPVINLAKVNERTCTLDPEFHLSGVAQGPDDEVMALLEGQDGALYVGGNFQRFLLRDESRNVPNLVKVSMSTGSPIEAFNGNREEATICGPDGPVTALAMVSVPDPGPGVGTSPPPSQATGDQMISKLVAGGSFSNYCGSAASNLIAMDPVTGGRESDLLTAGFGGPVYALAVDGTSLYVGGDRDLNQRGEYLERYGLDQGQTAPVAIQGLNGPVRALLVTSDSIFAGGDFDRHQASGVVTVLDGYAQFSKAGVFQSDFTPDAAGIPSSIFGFVSAIAYDSGRNELYLAGGRSRAVWGRIPLNAPTDSRIFDDFEVGSTFSALLIREAGVYAGGTASTHGGTPVSYLAKVDLNTLEADPGFFDGMQPDGPVHALALADISAVGVALDKESPQSLPNLLVGGEFTRFLSVRGSGDPADTKRFARFQILEGQSAALVGSSPGFGSGVVKAIAVTADALYVGGSFAGFADSSSGPESQLNGIAAFTISDGMFQFLSSFTQGSVGESGFKGPQGGAPSVNAIAVDASGSVYVGGSFVSYRGVNAQNFVKLLGSGSLVQDSTRAGIQGAVHAIALGPDGRVFVGGEFQDCASVADVGPLVSFSPGSFMCQTEASWNLSGAVYALGLVPVGTSTALLAGGSFQDGVKAIDIGTGSKDYLSTFGLQPLNGIVHAIAVTPDGFFLGGSFSSYGREDQILNSASNAVSVKRPDTTTDGGQRTGF